MGLKNLAWTEKYRPNNVKNVISIHTDTILNYLRDEESMPNFLFHSKTGGTGKSSMARAIINDLGCDVLKLNASADRSIDMIRNKVKEFARSASTNGKRRCIFMDEGEKLTKDAMDALKNMIEEYSANTFYIFTTNTLEKINQPMQSRFKCFEFSKPGREDVENFISGICKFEDIEYDEDAVKKLVSMNYPCIRIMVNSLQDLKMQNKKLEVNNLVEADNDYIELWKLIETTKFTELKTKIIENNVDVEAFNDWIFQHCLKGNIGLKKELKIYQSLSKNEKAFATSADKNIVFIAELVNIMMVMKS